MARHGQRRKRHWPTLVEQEGMGAGVAQRPPGDLGSALCPGSPDLPMKVVQELGAAQMLLLITETSQSNSLLVCVGGSGERGPVELEGWQNCPSRLGTTLGWRACLLSLKGQGLNPLRWFPAHPVRAHYICRLGSRVFPGT